MIEADDLRASVGAGIISERQAASLTALAHSRRGARENLAPGDEPFELFRGFNEIFIMVGLGILATGWFSVLGLIFADVMGVGGTVRNPQTTIAALATVTAAVVWALSEYFITRRRMVGPAIMLSILFAATVTLGSGQYFAQVFMLARQDYSSLVMPGILSIIAVLVFWVRFRVPFAMALIALGMFAVALLAAATRSGTPESIADVFTFSAEGSFAWITLVLGVVVFAVAMVFDGSDPYRVTRRSAQGFWLHIVAAPAIVNTVALSLLANDNPTAQAMLLVFLTFIAVVAITIDRRSFLMAAIGYSVGLSLTAVEGAGIAWLILALGVAMVLLGALWERIRAVILRILPLGGLRRFVPPSH
jgi:hypothetical protein